MADAIKPMCFFSIRALSGWQTQEKTKPFFVDPDGKRNETNAFVVLWHIRMADARKPMIFCASGWQTQENYCCCVYPHVKRNEIKVLLCIRMAIAIKPMHLLFIRVANAIQLMLF